MLPDRIRPGSFCTPKLGLGSSAPALLRPDVGFPILLDDSADGGRIERESGIPVSGGEIVRVGIGIWEGVGGRDLSVAD